MVDFSDIGGKPIQASIDFSDLGGKRISAGPDWMGVVKDALNEARMGNGSKMRDLMSDPVTQAKVLPILSGGGVAALGVPMGNTIGTVAGRQISNAALKAYGKENEIPDTASQLKEAAISGALDLTAIPFINKRVIGSQIGDVEKAAGVPAPQDIPSLPRPKAGDPVSGGIDSAIESVRSAEGGGTPTYWKQIKDQIDNFYNLGKDTKLTNLDKAKLTWLSARVQEGLNAAVPGREALSETFANSQKVPNAIKDAFYSVPSSIRQGMGVGAGTVSGGGLLYELGKRALGNR